MTPALLVTVEHDSGCWLAYRSDDQGIPFLDIAPSATPAEALDAALARINQPGVLWRQVSHTFAQALVMEVE
jgi:hypothetical protein